MIELFTIFSKGGIVLWCFQEGGQHFTDSINLLIREVLMQERSGSTVFKHNDTTIRYKLDNEFDLVFVIIYQSAVQLAYADQLLSDVHRKFRDMYKNVIANNKSLFLSGGRTFKQFTDHFLKLYRTTQLSSVNTHGKVMRTFEESEKSKKTIASMIERPVDHLAKLVNEKEVSKPLKQRQHVKDGTASRKPNFTEVNGFTASTKSSAVDESVAISGSPKSDVENEEIGRRRADFFKKKAPKKVETEKQITIEVKKGKQARIWDLSGKFRTDVAYLDYSKHLNEDNGFTSEQDDDRSFVDEQMQFVGKFKGELPGLDEEQSEDDDIEDESEQDNQSEASSKSWFSAFRSLVGNKKLSAEDVQPALEAMRETLIGKNVASEPADKLCQSVAVKLEGRVVGTFSRVASIVRDSFREALVQLLTPKRRIDILRDVLEAKSENHPYVIVFCGVNGVGKSTNLAKIAFWLNENGHNVLIAAGDTFRAGAVEQLRTHTKHLNALHPSSVQLFEQGYGKDPAGLAAAAVSIAVERAIDVVLVDTAGRMQDNEPLMRSLSKLIRVNEPDLVLFVGEALVGNEAVDQLVKFNQALADHAAPGAEARLIDGIVLTKFDTIDDKVGAAISMTYITGQPIVFVGTGQTYKDLKSLNANAVVHSLLK